MLSLLFASRARLTTELAVERTRREFLEQDNRTLRTRLADVEKAHQRLIDDVLARQGVIHQPLHDSAPKPSASPAESLVRAFGRTEFASGKLATHPSEAAMPSA